MQVSTQAFCGLIVGGTMFLAGIVKWLIGLRPEDCANGTSERAPRERSNIAQPDPPTPT